MTPAPLVAPARAGVSFAPLGFFDSGLGGLTVAREALKQLPGERIIYIGDSAHAPYGARSEADIRAFSLGMARFLLREFGCRGLIIACNTATAWAAESVRADVSVPVVGMEPAVKPAVAATKTGVVGILATVGTLRSARFAALLEHYHRRSGVTFLTQPCPGLPEAVEENRADAPETAALVEKYVAPLIARGADTLVLGCTHYPVLRSVIARAAGPNVTLIDTGEAVARRAATLFGAPLADTIARPDAASITLYTTGDVATFARGAAAILSVATSCPPRRLLWKNGELSHDDNTT